MEANNVVRIPTSLNGNFFRYWFQFLEPFHNLTHREIDVASEFLKYRWELSKVIKDEDLLDKIVMNSDTKKQIRERCNLTLQHFQIILGKLRKSKIIIDDKLNPRFIPFIKEDSNKFNLLFTFDLTDEPTSDSNK